MEEEDTLEPQRSLMKCDYVKKRDLQLKANLELQSTGLFSVPCAVLRAQLQLLEFVTRTKRVVWHLRVPRLRIISDAHV
ncbi:MAG: hypothetical protein SGPRY_003071 [Prymnesium sp.]